jgi:hypothetical protein
VAGLTPYPPRSSEVVDPTREVPRPIFGIDIDGTLGDYHLHFTRFAEAWLGHPLPPSSQYSGDSFARHLGLSKSRYRKIKLAYRRGGAKRSMPVFDGASNLTFSLRRRGAVVLLCTTRPYLSHENVDEDTRHWARRNKVQHDGILWGERKYRDLSRFGSRVVAVLEDEPTLLDQAREVGLTAVKRCRPYNLGADADLYAPDLYDAHIILHNMLDDWEREHR